MSEKAEPYTLTKHTYEIAKAEIRKYESLKGKVEFPQGELSPKWLVIRGSSFCAVKKIRE